MPLAPGYGETPVSDDEAVALLPQVRELLGDPITKADVYDLEQGVQEEVVEELVTAVLDGTLSAEDLLTDYFVRDLHQRLYGDIWTWAGVYRKRELNIGIAPELIAVELRGSLETIRYRWRHTDDWTVRELGIAAHAESVRIHPFTDGNGRATRLLADLVFVAAQDAETPCDTPGISTSASTSPSSSSTTGTATPGRSPRSSTSARSASSGTVG